MSTATATMTRASARPAAAGSTRRAGWTVRISPDLDLRPIKPSHFKMAAILERF
jgi:hypothetical protein